MYYSRGEGQFWKCENLMSPKGVLGSVLEWVNKHWSVQVLSPRFPAGCWEYKDQFTWALTLRT
jgi:hypothetical protein